MKTIERTRFGRIALASSAAFLAAALFDVTWGQQAQPAPSPEAQADREKAREKINEARDTQQAARQDTRDAREGARDLSREGRQANRETREGARDTAQAAREGTRDAGRDARDTIRDARAGVRDTRESGRDTAQGARENARDSGRETRQAVRDSREGARDTARDGRQTIREARRDIRAARREFIASRIRSGDLGLWLRQAADTAGMTVSDVSNRGVIAQSGLKEGDLILSVNGQPVTTERDFVDHLFADQTGDKPAQVVIKRGGKEMTITMNTKAFIEEHLSSDNKLADFGLILDESNPNQVRVQAVMPRSPAFYAGVRSGDQITGFNGQRIAAVADFIKQLATTSGTRVGVDVNRNNQTRQLDIEVPDDNVSDSVEARTALRPTLPDNQIAPPQPQRPSQGTVPVPAPQGPGPNNPQRRD